METVSQPETFETPYFGTITSPEKKPEPETPTPNRTKFEIPETSLTHHNPPHFDRKGKRPMSKEPKTESGSSRPLRPSWPQLTEDPFYRRSPFPPTDEGIEKAVARILAEQLPMAISKAMTPAKRSASTKPENTFDDNVQPSGSGQDPEPDPPGGPSNDILDAIDRQKQVEQYILGHGKPPLGPPPPGETFTLPAIDPESKKDDNPNGFAKPEKFDGKRKAARNFIRRCTLLFTTAPHKWRNHAHQILYVISYFKEDTAVYTWGNNIVDRMYKLQNEGWDISQYLQYPKFEEEFLTLYGEGKPGELDSYELRALNQGYKTTAEFLSEFQNLAANVPFNDAAILDILKANMNPDLLREIHRRRNLPDYLQLWYQAMNEVTSELKIERMALQRNKATYQMNQQLAKAVLKSRAAQVQTPQRNPVTDQSKVQCFNCFEFGHMRAQCRKPPRQRSVRRTTTSAPTTRQSARKVTSKQKKPQRKSQTQRSRKATVVEDTEEAPDSEEEDAVLQQQLAEEDAVEDGTESESSELLEDEEVQPQSDSEDFIEYL